MSLVSNTMKVTHLYKPKIVLIGIGNFGKNHLRVLKELEGQGACRLYGVVDIKSETLKVLGNGHKFKTSLDFHHFLEDDDVDAVDIVAPTSTHFAICKECLAAGKHVFVEKPLTTSYVEAKELVQIAEEQRKTLMVGHIFRYNFAVRKIKKLIERGELGQVYYLFGHFMGLKDPKSDVGALFNYTVHHIDIYDYLLQKMPEEVTCCVGFFLGRKEFEDLALLVLKYPLNVIGIVEGSWLPPDKQRDLTVVGSKKSITSNLLKQTLKLHDSHIEIGDGQFKAIDRGVTEKRMEHAEPLKLELLDFMNSIKTGREPLANGQVALNVIKVAQKALESARLRRSVRINENK